MEEAKIAISVVRAYYHDKEFAIITPYDPQRAEIARLLKMAGLPDKVFTVDSFQGHEADFIIASSVRTEKTGFLSSQFRMNVMLSRCKCGMVLVTNRAFIENPRTGAKTLLGRLAGHWQSFAGTYGPWVSKESVEAQEADLPGVRGPNRPLEALVTPVSPRDQRTVLPRATRTGPSSSYPTPISAGQSGAQLQGRWKQGFVPQTAPVLAPTRPHISRAQRPATDGYLRDPQDFPSLPLTEDDECFSRPRLQGRWEQGPSVSPGAAGSALARPIPTAESCWPF
ncbi:hypothetical protein FA95DRAFT_537798 [Auriscalpium vulgare]|uniref:Uncharacterized protein n=1 Tax=Auriscalpium vulgare TaxID=40419 RepID=A0ACB8RES4_9AGAM|nr:hypothetical protein FA95DRAFT_537798 [Auriscalpium vulgare]